MAAPERFGADPQQVRSMVLSAVADGIPIGTHTPRIADGQIGGWLDEASGALLMRLPAGWLSLLTPELQDAIVVRGRGLVVFYAAANLADATHPERAGNNARIGEVWWERWQTGVDQLAADVAAQIAIVEAEDADGDGIPDMEPYLERALGAIHVRPPTGWSRIRF